MFFSFFFSFYARRLRAQARKIVLNISIALSLSSFFVKVKNLGAALGTPKVRAHRRSREFRLLSSHGIFLFISFTLLLWYCERLRERPRFTRICKDYYHYYYYYYYSPSSSRSPLFEKKEKKKTPIPKV